MRMHEQRELTITEARSSELESSLERDMMSQIRDLNDRLTESEGLFAFERSEAAAREQAHEATIQRLTRKLERRRAAMNAEYSFQDDLAPPHTLGSRPAEIGSGSMSHAIDSRSRF